MGAACLQKGLETGPSRLQGPLGSGALDQGAGFPGALGKKEGLGSRPKKAGPGQINRILAGGDRSGPRRFDRTRKGISTVNVEMPLSVSAGAKSADSDVYRGSTLRPFLDFKCHLVALGQGFETITADPGKMNEDVRSIFLLNETVALLVAKPLDGTLQHIRHPPFSNFLIVRYWRCHSQTGPSLRTKLTRIDLCRPLMICEYFIHDLIKINKYFSLAKESVSTLV
jgi:hypothetical protein